MRLNTMVSLNLSDMRSTLHAYVLHVGKLQRINCTVNMRHSNTDFKMFKLHSSMLCTVSVLFTQFQSCVDRCIIYFLCAILRSIRFNGSQANRSV